MSNQQSAAHARDRGNLFANAEKKKPSQPDFQGDCTIDRVAYEIRGFRRGEQLAVTLAPPRGDRNTYPPDVFRGELEPAPPAPPAPRGGRKGAAAPVSDAPPTPAWSGDIFSDDAAYTVRAFEKQGKSGLYWTLTFERTERSAPTDVWVDAADADGDAAE